MKTIAIVRVHSQGQYTMTSKDFVGYKKFSSVESFNKFIKSADNIDITARYVDKENGVKIIYLKPFTYGENMDWAKKNFKAGSCKEIEVYWNNVDKEYYEKRARGGYVSCKPSKDMKPEDYRGKLLLSLTPSVLEYLSEGLPFGYLGHSFRKLSHDKLLEKIVKNSDVYIDNAIISNDLKWEIFGVWLTSSDARHWMDSREGQTLAEFEDCVREDIARIMKLGYIYGLEEHNGSLGSTMELSKEHYAYVEIHI